MVPLERTWRSLVMPAGMVKILFELDPDEWHRCPVETLWAKTVIKHDTGVFQIDNSPI
jgi:hypothetical protein